MTTTDNNTGLEIAVIGMSGRFPEAKNIHELWSNLKEGKEMITFFSDEELLEQGIPEEIIKNPNYIKAKGVLGDVENFDAPFFGYTNKEADYMDPQFRVFHECVYHALEDAGYADPKYRGVTGLFAGAGFNPFWMANFLPSFKNFSEILEISSLNAREFLTTRVAYKLGLNGPTMTLQTACSTSLVAVHMACQSLLSGEADMALAGGISILFPSIDLPRKYGMQYQEGNVISKDGHCKPFDKDANGFMGGDGVGVVVLKRLEDAIEQGDNIYAVIKASAMNNDGNAKIGYSAPSIDGQTDVIETALQLANVKPETIEYIETHGSGTKLGDPIEVQALINAYNLQNGNHCGIGSIKSNFGHLDAAAGIAGFIKTVLTLKNEQIPPSINFNEPNPNIDFENSPFYVNTLLQDWKTNGIPRRAAVSSFGIGGTNAHLVMEEAPSRAPQKSSDSEHLILLSAKTKSALVNTCQTLKDHLEVNPEINLQDLAYTLQVGRRTFEYKRGITCNSVSELIDQLSPEITNKKIIGHKVDESSSMVFVFTGLGGQYADMGLDLYLKLDSFRKYMDEGFGIVRKLCGTDLKPIMYPTTTASNKESDCSEINQFDNAQLSLFLLERALAKVFMSWGIVPVAVIGYSFGEYTAAHIAGVMSLGDTIKLILKRGELILQCEEGAMLSVPIKRSELGELPQSINLAIDNGETCVVSGPVEAIDLYAKRMKKDRHICMRLAAERAIHSSMMQPVFESLKETLSDISLSTPSIPMVSNVTGTWVDDMIASPDYWLDHLAKTVEFANGIETLLTLPNTILMEIGPGADISSTLHKFIENDPQHFTLNTIKPAAIKIADMGYLKMRLQKLWQRGIDIHWEQFYEKEKPKRISIPGYSFDKHRYWFKDREKATKEVAVAAPSNLQVGEELVKNKDHSQWYYLPSWQQSFNINTTTEFNAISSWLVFADDTDFSNSLINELKYRNQEVVVLKKGVSFNRINQGEFTINPLIEGQYQYLLNDLIEDGVVPGKVLHLWSSTPLDIERLNDSDIEGVIANGFHSLTNLVKVMYENDLNEEPCEIFVITKEMYKVIGNESLMPIHANILGACRVLPIEFRNITCRQIDIQADDHNTLEQILNELIIERPDPVIALRNNHIWAQTYDKLSPQHNPSDFANIIKNDNVYVIVGGLCSRSNLGFILSKHLSDTAPVKIVLLSRTEYPKRADWKSLIAKDEANGIKNKLDQIKEIEEGHGQVYTFSADITKFEQLQLAIQEIEKEVGKINGVINVAGIMDEQSMGLVISTNSQQHFKSQFDIKVKGTINLYKAFKDIDLDFCVLSSSLTSVMGPFAAYCAGNNFMDALVQQINQGDDKAWLSINWDHLLGFNDKQEDQPLAIDHAEIIEVFESIMPLSQKLPQVVISSTDIKRRIEKTLNIKPTQSRGPLSKRKSFSKWFYEPVWQKTNLDTTFEGPQENTLVFMRPAKFNAVLLEELKQHSSTLATVLIGEKFESDGLNFTIDPSNPQHYSDLFQALKEINFTYSSIFHLWNSSDHTTFINEETIAESQQIGFYSLLNIAKAIGNLTDQSKAVNVLTNNMQHVTDQEDLCPEKASMLGAIKVLPVENNALRCTSLDIDSAEVKKYSKTKLKELALGMIGCSSKKVTGFQTIAYRENQWFTEGLAPVNLSKTDSAATFKNNGTYLMTGGLGGMALNIMEHISKNYQANFIIIDEISLPPRKEWKKSIEALTNDATRIKQLQNIERSGSRFTLIEGDISDYNTIQKDVADGIAAYGKVDGAFHIAGMIDHAGIIQTRSFEETEKVMAPKLQGALVLDRVLQGESLDFIVYLSSTGNVFPRLKFGQVAYNAGHEFLDIYAHAKRKSGENAYVINSNDWHGVGIAGEAAKTHSYSLKNYDVSFNELLSIKPKEGIYSLSAILESKHPQVIVSAYDVNELQNFINNLDFSEIVAGGSDEQKSNDERTRDDLSSKYIKPTTALQEKLVEVFEEIFRIEHVGIEDDFFELGGDSIKAISAISIIQQKHTLDLPITVFFEKRTIRNIAAYFGESAAIDAIQEPKPDDIEVIEDDDFYLPFPISPIQMAYFMGRSDQFDMGGISTNVYQESEITVDLEALNLAFNIMLNRHPMLKIVFLEDGQQQFHRVDKYEIKNSDLRGLDQEAQKDFLEKERKRLNNYLFNASQWPLYEISTCTLADGKHYLFFCFDHLICDAASLMILVKEWGKLIKDLDAPLPKLQYTYRDYIIDFQEQRNSSKFESSKKYWLDRLDSFPSAPAIPTKVDPSEIKKPKFNRQRKVFPKADWNKLKVLAKESNCTPSTVLCAAYARVLSHWCNSNDLAINLTLFNRYPFHDDVQRVVGDFTMLVLLGVNLDPGKDFLNDVKNVQRTLLEALDNRFYDGIDFIREIRKSRQLGTSAIMPFVFTSALFDSDLIASEEDEVLGVWGQQRDSGQAVSQTSQVYIDCTSAELNEGLELVWDYVEELFDKEIIETMFSQFVSLITNFINKDTKTTFQIPKSHLKIIDQTNETDSQLQSDTGIIGIFETQVAKTPENIALRFNDEVMTFEGLNEKANLLARNLVTQGVKSEVPVALLAQRSFDMMIGIFAILKAGGVYLPIAANNPTERIEYMLKDAGVDIVLVQNSLLDKLPKEVKSLVLEDENNYEGNDRNLDVTIAPDQLAYIIYTSGSSGKPKGVMIEHRALGNRLNWMQNSYPLSSSDRLVQKTPISFDVSIWELFWWVFEGASLTLLPMDDEKSPERLMESIANNQVSTIHFVPSMFDLFLNHLEETESTNKIVTLKRIYCSGEELLPTHVQRFYQLFNNSECQLINLYGPTEATIDVSYFNCNADQMFRTVPIGKPIDNTKLYILNESLQKVPVGVPGQLYISGIGVARGYVNNEDLTRERFISNPFINGQTMYATGDRAKQLSSGEIVYLGRLDAQVKLKGNRIELGEIENNLIKINGVSGAVVAVKTDNQNHKYLCGYLVAKEEIETKVLRQQLSQWVPDYMIPTHYHFMDSIPLTSNGKVNRNLLPDPGKKTGEGVGHEPPKTELENHLVEMYAELLNIENPSVNDSFFDLGGDSFKATFLLTNLQKAIGIKVSLGQVFKTPSIRELAQNIQTNRESLYVGAYESIPKVEKQDYYPLSQVQKRLLAQHGEGKGAVTLNIFMNQRLKGSLDPEKFEKAFTAVIERHEILRTSFELKKGTVYQRIQDNADCDFTFEDLRSASPLDKFIEEKTNELAYHSFDLFKGQLFKVKLLQVGNNDFIILFAVHHILFDLWSQQIFIRDLFHYYNAFVSNGTPMLPALSIQYKDYSQWHNQTLSSEEMAKHQQYWLDTLSGKLPVLQLATDRPRPPKQTFVGDEVYFEIPSDLVLGVKEFLTKHDATLFMALMAALKGLLFKYTGQSDIIIGTPIADREHPDLKEQLGCYINTIPIRDNINNKAGFDELIQQVKKNTLDGYEHQACPFDWITESVDLTPDPSRSPLFDVSLVVSQDFDFDEFQNNSTHNIKVSAIRKNLKISKTDLLFQFVDTGESILGTIQYNTDLFNHKRVERMAEHLLILTKTLLDNPKTSISEINYLTEEESKIEKQSVNLFSSSIEEAF